MDEPTPVPEDAGSLQFDRAEPAAGPAPAFSCAFCATPLSSYYFEINGKPACEGCRYRVEEQLGARPGTRGFLKAAGAGAAAAAAGCGLYYAVRELTGYEIGLVAIVVGFMVGGAVRWGTQRRGGRAYQLLAVFLTYMAIACTYLPMILHLIRDQQAKRTKAPITQPAESDAAPASSPAAAAAGPGAEKISPGLVVLAVAFLFAMAAAAPILAGFHSPILLLILGFGLWEAWKMNRRIAVSITGPLQIGPSSAPSLPAG
jgi:hypothetical protein